jgi:peptidyl-dipeptidase Dcp
MSTDISANPFTSLWKHPLGAPAFDSIEDNHFEPAIKWAIEKAKDEVESIAANGNPPTFENTIQELDRVGKLLKQVLFVFENMVGADSRPTLEETDRVVTPLLSEYQSHILLHEKLFDRIKSVAKSPNRILEGDEQKLLEDTYRDFLRGGAELSVDDQNRLKALKKELAVKMLQFRENVLKDTAETIIWVENVEELEGVPESVLDDAKERAQTKGKPDAWAFIGNRVIVEAVTTFATSRSLRKALYEAYTKCADRGNQQDNNSLVADIANLRVELAALLGHKHYASYALKEQMAGNPESVAELLTKVLVHARKTAQKEISDMQVMLESDCPGEKIQAWDYRYYAEKVRKQRFDLSESELEVYFAEDQVKHGIFNLMERLYGVKIARNDSVPVYRDDVEAWDVKEADGTYIGLIYLDYTVRDNKHAGAWMHYFREQIAETGGLQQTPVVVNVCNFPKATETKPSLLNLWQIKTAFHEFGHATHGLFSKCRFWKQTGTSVATDFVELPSQILENWAMEPALLKEYAKHFQTGETIPDELIEKIRRSLTFNQGFFTIEYLAAALLDLEYHLLETPLTQSASDFERSILEKYGIPSEIAPRYRSTYFQHIFAGGYGAGYYSYMWSEVLDADAYDAFPSNNKFDRATAEKFREWVLSKGGSKDPMALYKAFRGEAPSVEPLLRRRGFLSE